MYTPTKEIRKCPNCSHDLEFNIWSTINTKENPEIIEEVKEREIFRKECPNCKKITEINYNTLYHDVERKFMVDHINNKGSIEEDLEIQAMLKNNELDGYKLRITRSLSDFIEKITILEKNLDDYIIEFMKTIIINQTPEDMKQDLKKIYFFDLENNKVKYLALNKNSQEFVYLPMKAYEDIQRDDRFNEPSGFQEVTLYNLMDYFKMEERKWI